MTDGGVTVWSGHDVRTQAAGSGESAGPTVETKKASF